MKITCHHRLLRPAAVMFAGLGLLAGCADTGDLITSGSTAATSASTTAEANDFANARQFAESQHVALRRDVAAGEGEHLEAFAILMNEPDGALFGQWMQSNYAALYQGSSDDRQLVDRVLALREQRSTIERVAVGS